MNTSRSQLTLCKACVSQLPTAITAITAKREWFAAHAHRSVAVRLDKVNDFDTQMAVGLPDFGLY